MEDTILALEKKLLDMSFCRDIKNLEDILAADFVEYGSSGEVYSRKEAIEKLICEDQRKIEIQNFKAKKLAEKVYLATYITDNQDSGIRSYRSSIWVIRESGLQLLFHQGTLKRSH